MYYKVIKDSKVIDVLNGVVYLRWQPKNKIMVLSDINSAQAILSSDGNDIWHEETLYNLTVDGYDTVRLVEIDKYEYNQLKALSLKTPQEIIDAYTLSLIDGGVL